MPVRTKEELKAMFQAGKEPNQSNYVDLIDTMGDGDMQASIYDANANNIVDNAEALGGIVAANYVRGGLGHAIDISGTDLDDLVSTGFYRGNLLYNSPYGLNWTYVMVVSHSTSYAIQHVYNFYNVGSQDFYTRRLVNGLWEDWIHVYPAQWADIDGKPSSFTPSTHTHIGSQITSPVSEADLAENAATVRGYTGWIWNFGWWSMYEGTSRTSANNGTVDLSTLSGIPNGIRGVSLVGSIQSTSISGYVWFGTDANNIIGGERNFFNTTAFHNINHICPCDGNGNMRLTYGAGATYNVYLRINGYAI